MDLASHWKAALLLDEADVFVEKRKTDDIVRNSIVCLFLRKLEYYSGILFLTTNRVTVMDEAIASRIHLPLRYDNLDNSARKLVWKNLLQAARTKHGSAECTGKDIESLAIKKLNGREVSSVAFKPTVVD